MKKGSTSVIKILFSIIAILIFVFIVFTFTPGLKATGETLYNMSNVTQLIGTDIFSWGGKNENTACSEVDLGGAAAKLFSFNITSNYLDHNCHLDCNYNLLCFHTNSIHQKSNLRSQVK